MRVRLFELADSANTTADGRLNILGVFDRIVAKKLGEFPLFSLALILHVDSTEKGTHIVEIEIENPESQVVLMMGAEAEFELPDGQSYNAKFAIPVRGLPLTHYGTYKVRLIVKDYIDESIELHVLDKA